jgi:archaellum component FlaC
MNYPNKLCKPFIALPTVFSDQLSWYETLSKLYGYLQQQEEVIKEIQEQLGNGGGGTIPEGLEEDINNLKQAVAELQQTVQQLSNAISVQNESIHTLTNRVSALEGRPEYARINEISSLTELSIPEVQTDTFVPITL